MKNCLLFCCLFIICLPAALAQTPTETAIREAIEAESKAYHTSPDRAAFLNYWHITPGTQMVFSGTDGSSVYVTGKQIKAASGHMPPPDQAVNIYFNYFIRANGPIAWVAFDEMSTLPDGTIKYMHEFRGMEQIEGQWKTVTSSVHQYKP